MKYGEENYCQCCGKHLTKNDCLNKEFIGRCIQFLDDIIDAKILKQPKETNNHKEGGRKRGQYFPFSSCACGCDSPFPPFFFRNPYHEVGLYEGDVDNIIINRLYSFLKHELNCGNDSNSKFYKFITGSLKQPVINEIVEYLINTSLKVSKEKLQEYLDILPAGLLIYFYPELIREYRDQLTDFDWYLISKINDTNNKEIFNEANADKLDWDSIIHIDKNDLDKNLLYIIPTDDKRNIERLLLGTKEGTIEEVLSESIKRFDINLKEIALEFIISSNSSIIPNLEKYADDIYNLLNNITDKETLFNLLHKLAYYKISENFFNTCITPFLDKIDLKSRIDVVKEIFSESQCINLSEEFIRKHYCPEYDDSSKILNNIIKYQTISEEFLKDYAEVIISSSDNINDIILYQPQISDEFIDSTFNLEGDMRAENVRKKRLYNKSVSEIKDIIEKSGQYECFEDYFIAYKIVTKSRRSKYNSKIVYNIGDIISEKRNRNRDNSTDSFGYFSRTYGLYVRSKESANKNIGNFEQIISVKINYSDVENMEQFSSNELIIKCCKLEVLN